MKNDLFEMGNRYNDPNYSEIIKQLKLEPTQRRKDLNEEDNKYAHIQKVIVKHWND